MPERKTIFVIEGSWGGQFMFEGGEKDVMEAFKLFRGARIVDTKYDADYIQVVRENPVDITIKVINVHTVEEYTAIKEALDAKKAAEEAAKEQTEG